MTYNPTSGLQVPLDENITFSEEWENFLQQFTQVQRKMARKINEKESGFYPRDYEIINSQRFFDIANPQTFRSVFRKAFSFGAIAAGAILPIAHGITQQTSFTGIYGTVVTAVVDYRPLPYVALVLNQQISLRADAANIIIENGAGAPAITSGFVILEYLKE